MQKWCVCCVGINWLRYDEWNCVWYKYSNDKSNINHSIQLSFVSIIISEYVFKYRIFNKFPNKFSSHNNKLDWDWDELRWNSVKVVVVAAFGDGLMDLHKLTCVEIDLIVDGGMVNVWVFFMFECYYKYKNQSIRWFVAR